MDSAVNAENRRKILHWLWLPVIGLGLYYYFWLWNPLPSDEVMIENFTTHRADFVEAVRRYRDYPRPPDKDTSLWFKDGDTLELFKRAGIDNIDYGNGVWFPNPYSPETDKKIVYEITENHNRGVVHQYGALKITPATTPRIDHPGQMDDRSYRRNTLLFGVIWKDYYFFPEVPRIENGALLGPVNHKGEYSFRSRTLHSLNRFPINWKGFECVYRQIEPQWFLRMCNGSH